MPHLPPEVLIQYIINSQKSSLGHCGVFLYDLFFKKNGFAPSLLLAWAYFFILWLIYWIMSVQTLSQVIGCWQHEVGLGVHQPVTNCTLRLLEILRHLHTLGNQASHVWYADMAKSSFLPFHDSKISEDYLPSLRIFSSASDLKCVANKLIRTGPT